jgi:hypothetical protein
MPSKQSVVAIVDTRSPEVRWFAAQRESVIKIREFESSAEQMQKKAARLVLVVEGYDIVIAAQLDKTLKMDVNDPALEAALRELRVSRRYRSSWEEAQKLAQRMYEQNQNTIQTLRRLLASAPYPGESPLVDSPPLPEELKENATGCSRTTGEGDHVARPEATP